MGVRTEKVKRVGISRSIRALGTVTYDERKIHTVNTKFDGWIERLYVDFVGERVKRGQPLFDIYSPELVSAQEEYRLALEQHRKLAGSPYQSVRESAKRLLSASRKRLAYWDLTKSQIERIETGGDVRKTVTVYSPANGVVIEKQAFEGHFVKAGAHQYEIADLSTVWVDAEIYEYELPFIEEGMPAEMELSYIPGRTYRGRVIFVYPFLTPETRTARLRVEFENPEGDLKPDMYANVFLESAVAKDAVAVPQEAVIDSGVRQIVFVARGKGRFEPREIRIGAEGGEGRYQVLDGLEAGEEVVVSAQFMLDSESRLREAIQKMIDVRSGGGDAAEDLDMSGMDMDMDAGAEDLDMSGLDMGDMSMDEKP
jgi:Cu(I)/Ag(I) efflux system membrane fusion protein/cobalt-zinc-cadmium efflux system membrane fusion protein